MCWGPYQITPQGSAVIEEQKGEQRLVWEGVRSSVLVVLMGLSRTHLLNM